MDNPPTVLFVDDERALADGYAATFSEYDTQAAYDGETALELVDETVDVVVLDRRMPRMSGKEVLDAIRERGYDCRVVMLTSVKPDSDVVEMGFDEYLVKPVQQDELRETIDRLAPSTADELDEFDDALLEALGDPKTRRCRAALVDTARSAHELTDETGYSLPTVYRRLNALQQAGLIESESEVDPDGDHYQTFRAVPMRVHVELAEDVQVTVERPDRSTA